jgi:hypothetical protein
LEGKNRPMESLKTITFKDEENEYNIILQEKWNDNYGVFLWPCSLILSNYIFKERKNLLFKESIIYEVILLSKSTRLVVVQLYLDYYVIKLECSVLFYQTEKMN